MTTPRYVHIASIGRTSGRQGSIFRHRTDEAPDACERAGLAVTRLRRTIADCAGLMTFTDSVALVDAGLARLMAEAGGERANLAGQELIRAELLSMIPSYHAVRARAVLDFADCRSGSPAESKARVLLRGLRPPGLRLQQEIETSAGRFRPDFAIPSWGVLIEVDGTVKISDPYGGDAVAALVAERRRHFALQEAGWELVRLEWSELRPDVLHRKVSAARDQARRRGIVLSETDRPYRS